LRNKSWISWKFYWSSTKVADMIFSRLGIGWVISRTVVWGIARISHGWYVMRMARVYRMQSFVKSEQCAPEAFLSQKSLKIDVTLYAFTWTRTHVVFPAEMRLLLSELFDGNGINFSNNKVTANNYIREFTFEKRRPFVINYFIFHFRFSSVIICNFISFSYIINHRDCVKREEALFAFSFMHWF